MPNQSVPVEKPADERENIRRLFSKGEFDKAALHCKRAGRVFGEFQAQIDQGAHHLLTTRRAGVILNFMHKYNVRVPYELPVLIQAVFDAGDYHGFLKNIHRFKVVHGFDAAIAAAAAALTEKGHSADAAAWEKKIHSLRQQ